MAEGIDSSMLAIIQRFQRGEMRSEQAINAYLQGEGTALEAFLATVFDAMAVNTGPASVIANLLIQALLAPTEESIGQEAWTLLRREAQGFGAFLQLTKDANMSPQDKMLVFDAYVTPALQRIGDWVVNHIIYPEPEEQAIEIIDGAPFIRGTRMKVRMIAEELRNGSSVGGVMETHPHLTFDQIRAAIGYYRAHEKEMDAQIDELQQRREANRRPTTAPTREQLQERLGQQGMVMTPQGLKRTA
jgi:uncharacterized protein (DUF433 family)